jgi:hypothetical protein
LALAVLLSVQQPLLAAEISPVRVDGTAAAPVVGLLVNGEQVALTLDLTQDPEKAGHYFGTFSGGVADQWQIQSGSLEFNADPVVSYSFGVINFSNSPTAFAFTFLSPYVGGAYGSLQSSHSSSVTDGTPKDGAVTVNTVAPKSFVHTPQVDGGDIAAAALSNGCALTGSAGFSGTCFGASNVTVPVTTALAGTFGTTVTFSLSARDQLSTTGTVELANVPEPQSALLLMAGFAAFAGVLFRRRVA